MAVKWSPWTSLGKPVDTEIGRPFVQRNQDGRLEVFAAGQGEMFNISQVSPNGAWRNDWRSKGRPSAQVGIRAHVVGTNADGRLEIFAVGEDNAVWQKWQVAPNSGWTDAWATLSGPTSEQFPLAEQLLEQLTVGRNQDGRQEVFGIWSFNGAFGGIFQNWQIAPNGGWSGWKQMFFSTGATQTRGSDRLTVGRNQDGRQELFAVTSDHVTSEQPLLRHLWQVFPNAGWSEWESLGRPRDPFPEPQDRDLSQPVVQRNADGHLEVFVLGNGAFCNRWQEPPLNTPVVQWRRQGWNAKPRPQPDVGLTSLEAAINVGGPLNGHIEVFGLGDDGGLWHAWQIDQAPNWSHWESLATPPVAIRDADRLTVGTHRDGRLEVFVAGDDGAVWRIAQTR